MAELNTFRYSKDNDINPVSGPTVSGFMATGAEKLANGEPSEGAYFEGATEGSISWATSSIKEPGLAGIFGFDIPAGTTIELRGGSSTQYTLFDSYTVVDGAHSHHFDTSTPADYALAPAAYVTGDRTDAMVATETFTGGLVYGGTPATAEIVLNGDKTGASSVEFSDTDVARFDGFVFDFGRQVNVTKLRYAYETMATNGSSLNRLMWYVSISNDGISWTEIDTVTGCNFSTIGYNEREDNLSIHAGHRYLRLRNTETYSGLVGYTARIREIEFCYPTFLATGGVTPNHSDWYLYILNANSSFTIGEIIFADQAELSKNVSWNFKEETVPRSSVAISHGGRYHINNQPSEVSLSTEIYQATETEKADALDFIDAKSGWKSVFILSLDSERYLMRLGEGFEVVRDSFGLADFTIPKTDNLPRYSTIKLPKMVRDESLTENVILPPASWWRLFFTGVEDQGPGYSFTIRGIKLFETTDHSGPHIVIP
ncbi:MAG: hypothetical protein HQL67_10870, partial [Magnetococcales bacterium]|nr:hypothetical protein [Magnetococcales bacterium]